MASMGPGRGAHGCDGIVDHSIASNCRGAFDAIVALGCLDAARGPRNRRTGVSQCNSRHSSKLLIKASPTIDWAPDDSQRNDKRSVRSVPRFLSNRVLGSHDSGSLSIPWLSAGASRVGWTLHHLSCLVQRLTHLGHRMHLALCRQPTHVQASQ